MSLYNLLFGMNPLSDLFLGMVGLTRADTGRFRDAYVEKVGDETKSPYDSSNYCGWVLCVYTRNGGGNREAGYGAQMEVNPYYLSDEDDDFDCTYATYRFQIPTQFWPFLEELNVASSAESTPRQRWDRLFEKLNMAKDDPEVRNAMSVMQPVLTKIKEVLDSPPPAEAESNG